MPYSEGVNIAGGIAGILADFIGRTVVRERAVETAPEGATRHEVRLRGLGSGGDIAGLADFVAGILAGDAAGMWLWPYPLNFWGPHRSEHNGGAGEQACGFAVFAAISIFVSGEGGRRANRLFDEWRHDLAGFIAGEIAGILAAGAVSGGNGAWIRETPLASDVADLAGLAGEIAGMVAGGWLKVNCRAIDIAVFAALSDFVAANLFAVRV